MNSNCNYSWSHNKQPWVWYNHNLLPIKDDKLKPKSTWGPDDKFRCHDQQVLP